MVEKPKLDLAEAKQVVQALDRMLEDLGKIPTPHEINGDRLESNDRAEIEKFSSAAYSALEPLRDIFMWYAREVK